MTRSAERINLGTLLRHTEGLTNVLECSEWLVFPRMRDAANPIRGHRGFCIGL
ncbi:hypothetical protein [Rhizobium grahamii]|uniref:hypothetical protein n=1 Tax=Rhizobium grahamii TaxID=1120045 RepID=UPI001FCA511D|nr:hypothetical protein [Rhizobium grahamii]